MRRFVCQKNSDNDEKYTHGHFVGGFAVGRSAWVRRAAEDVKIDRCGARPESDGLEGFDALDGGDCMKVLQVVCFSDIRETRELSKHTWSLYR